MEELFLAAGEALAERSTVQGIPGDRIGAMRAMRALGSRRPEQAADGGCTCRPHEAPGRGPAAPHQIRQTCFPTIGCPSLQAKALANAGTLGMSPLTRHTGGEWGSVRARSRSSSGRSMAQAHWA